MSQPARDKHALLDLSKYYWLIFTDAIEGTPNARDTKIILDEINALAAEIINCIVAWMPNTFSALADSGMQNSGLMKALPEGFLDRADEAVTELTSDIRSIIGPDTSNCWWIDRLSDSLILLKRGGYMLRREDVQKAMDSSVELMGYIEITPWAT